MLLLKTVVSLVRGYLILMGFFRWVVGGGGPGTTFSTSSDLISLSTFPPLSVFPGVLALLCLEEEELEIL